MIVTGDWVIPVSGRPIRDGAVLVRGSRIEAVAPLVEIVARSPGDPVERFEGCALVPGLVNAHTHLSLTVLAGLIPRTDMRRFLAQAAKAILAMSNDDFAASAAAGALECLRCGVTTVGDIVYGPEPLAACADAGVGGVFFWEVFGIDAGDLSGELAEAEFPSDVGACTKGRARCGVSPHTAYSSGPDLLVAEWKVAQRHNTEFALHVSESEAERQLMFDGTGPLLDVARRLARGFTVPRTSTVAYLDRLGVIKDALAVHCARLAPGDAAVLKRKARGVALCPRSNQYLGNGNPPVAELSAAGVTLALGTDSPASNDDLDLFEEGRAVRKLDPTLTARRVLAMMTADAAACLGLGGWCGALAPGLQADVTVLATGATEDPENAVVRRGGRNTVRAVLSGGLWRVRDGKAALPTTAAERAAARAREVASRALSQ